MNLNAFIDFIHKNFTPILGGITIISFIINIIQYRTKKNVRYFLDSIYQTSVRTVRMNEKKEKSNTELIHILYIIRDQTVSGLRSVGIRRSYGSYDSVSDQGVFFRFFRNSYRLIMKIKEKWPTLFKRKKNSNG